ncbi:MAG TPA: hypothetical protein VEI52_02210 [Terriglobales bacterium]|nr:hypothetical protein [Terriglobales bacterium]
MKRGIFAVAFCLLLSTLALGQTVRLLTKEDWIKRHPNQSVPNRMNADTATTTTDLSRVRIGTFESFIIPTNDWGGYWGSGAPVPPDGSSYYDFWWFNYCDFYPPETCYYYTGPITFSGVGVYANGTSLSYATPFTTGPPYIGIEFGAGPNSGFPANNLSNCNPLKPQGKWKIIAQDQYYAIRSSCISIALQLVSSGPTNTFTLLNGDSYRAYGVINSFLTPELGHRDVYTYCDVNSGCYGSWVPIYANKKVDK